MTSTDSRSSCFTCSRNRGSGIRLISNTAFILPEWAPGGLVRLILPKDLARTTFVLCKSRMAVLWILNRSPSSRSVSRCASLLRWAWISINPCSKLIRDHHEPRTVIAKDTRWVRVTISWTGTKIAVPLMVVSLLLPTRLLVLLMHLHNLHDRLLHLYLIASREFAARRVIWYTERVFFRLSF